MLTYNCPATNRLVHTAIETTKETLKRMGSLKVSVWCPHCQSGHQIAACDAIVYDNRLPVTPPADWLGRPLASEPGV